MRRMLALATFFVLTSLPALALPSDFDNVVRSCGTPLTESRENSPVTGAPQRSITYPGNITLRFQPEPPGWGFTVAWHNSHSASRDEIAGLLPCFRTAMQQSLAQSGPRQATPANSTGTAFGVPHFWLIVSIGAAAFLLLIIIPGARQRRRAKLEKENAEALAHAHPPAHHPGSGSEFHAASQHTGGEFIPPQHRVVKHDPDL